MEKEAKGMIGQEVEVGRSARKISFPQMGNYSRVIAEQLKQRLHWNIVAAPASTSRSLEKGAGQLNELICLPAKATLGNMIEACDAGATNLLQFDSCGECRLKTYWILQERALRRLGYQARVHPIRLGIHTPGDIRKVDPSVSWPAAWQAFISTLSAIVRTEPKQPIIGQPPNIGIIGEIFSILDDSINRRLFTKLERLGCFVHNSLPLSYFAYKKLYQRGLMKRRDMDERLLKKAKGIAHQTFPKEIGGHGNESLVHTVYYALAGYDGIIHVAPFPCMPESTVSSCVDDLAREYGISVLHLTFDVQTAEAGMVTRLEAFTDMLKRKGIVGKRSHF